MKREKNLIEVLNDLDTLLKLELGHKTYLTYTGFIGRLSDYLREEGMETIKPPEFSSIHAVHYLDSVILRGLKARTRNNYLANTRAVFNRLITRGYLRNNPFVGISKLPVSEVIPATFTPSELTQIFAYLKSEAPNVYTGVILCYYAAARPAEARRLRVGDIDFKEGAIRFEGTQTKNRRNASIIMPTPLVEELVGLGVDKAPANYFVLGKEGRPSLKQIGTNNLGNGFRKQLLRLREYGGLKADGCTLYSLKYTLVKDLFEAGYSAPEVQAHLRHSDLSTTQIYARMFGGIVSRIKHFRPFLGHVA